MSSQPHARWAGRQDGLWLWVCVVSVMRSAPHVVSKAGEGQWSLAGLVGGWWWWKQKWMRARARVDGGGTVVVGETLGTREGQLSNEKDGGVAQIAVT
jgi:hypothetical protein